LCDAKAEEALKSASTSHNVTATGTWGGSKGVQHGTGFWPPALLVWSVQAVHSCQRSVCYWKQQVPHKTHCSRGNLEGRKHKIPTSGKNPP